MCIYLNIYTYKEVYIYIYIISWNRRRAGGVTPEGHCAYQLRLVHTPCAPRAMVNQFNDEVDSDQKVINKELSFYGTCGT